jgi:predicted GIY-YIG superfamily endonuclease
MERQWSFRTFDECAEEAAKYETRKQFEKGSPKYYDYARRYGWLDEICVNMTVLRESWLKHRCLEIASHCESIQDFRTVAPSAYEKCWKKGWLEEATKHMEVTRSSRTLEECIADASKYKHRSEYKIGNCVSYSYAQQHGWLDEVCKNMERVGDAYWRMLYVYEFKDGAAYVGLTCNFTRRHWQHLNEEVDPVYKHIAKGHTEYELKKLSDYISKDEAAKMEDDYITKYRNEGWHMLNTRRGGGLGYPRRNMKKKKD